jgi:predicted DNA-binding ribbon-helix-helix protein
MTRINRNVPGGPKGRTSIRLEPEFWDALASIARVEGLPEREVLRRAVPEPCADRTAAVRVWILEWYRRRTVGGEG